MSRKVVYQNIVVPNMVGKRGTIPITRTYDGVGKIRVASGTTDEPTFIKIVQMMDELYNHGNLTTLESIRDKVVKPMVAYDTIKKQGVNSVISVNQALTIRHAVEEWLQTHTVKENTRRGYESHLVGFFNHIKDTDTIKDLPKKLESYRNKCHKKGIGRSFNQLRAVLMAFAKKEFRKRSQVYQEIVDVEVLPVVKKIHNDAISVEQMVEFVKSKTINKHHEDIIWSSCYSGMRPGEYMEDEGVTWEVKDKRIYITKTDPGHGNKGYSRITILPFPISKPQRGHKALFRALKKRSDELGYSVTPNTFRKCFAHWADEAGISTIRLESYMGHTTKTINDLYKQHEVETYLEGDAKLFRDYVNGKKNPAPPPPKKKSGKFDDINKWLPDVTFIDIADI